MPAMAVGTGVRSDYTSLVWPGLPRTVDIAIRYRRNLRLPFAVNATIADAAEQLIPTCAEADSCEGIHKPAKV